MTPNRSLATCMAVALAVSALLARPAHAGIINGEFTGGWGPWTLSGLGVGSFDFAYESGFGHSAPGSIRFGAASAGALNSCYQVVSLTPGTTYELSLWVYNLGVGDDLLSIRIFQGGDFTNVFDLNPISTALESWEQITVQFTATHDSAAIDIVGYDQISTFYFDDVTLTAVPAPAAGVMLGLGALALGQRRRR